MEMTAPLVEDAVRRLCDAWHGMMADNERCLAMNGPRSRSAAAAVGGNALLLVTVYRHEEECTDVALMDPRTGETVRRMDGLISKRGLHACAGGDMLCVVNAINGVLSLVDAATGHVTDLTPGPTTVTPSATNVYSGYTLGHVSSTGVHKLLHVYDYNDKLSSNRNNYEYSSEVLTVTGRGGEWWRQTGAPPMRVEHKITRGSATVDGVVYFLADATSDRITDAHGRVVGSDSVAAFDLATEQWNPNLITGPLTESNGNHPYTVRRDLALTALAGRLVVVHHNYASKTIELYALVNSSNTLRAWTKTHELPLTTILRGWDKPACGPSEPMKPGRRGGLPKRGRTAVVLPTKEQVKAAIEAVYKELVGQPLMMLEDGRIAVLVRGKEGAVRVYDPKTGVCEDVVRVGRCGNIVGVYTGCV
uniref:F-box associated domain-containing protein n=1 Tax=Leersia perrieri TaxID=77586 RepID=A0A0D9UZU5_9ORYZ